MPWCACCSSCHMPSDFRVNPRLRFFMAAKDSRMRSVALPATAWARAAALFAPNLRLQPWVSMNLPTHPFQCTLDGSTFPTCHTQHFHVRIQQDEHAIIAVKHQIRMQNMPRRIAERYAAECTEGSRISGWARCVASDIPVPVVILRTQCCTGPAIPGHPQGEHQLEHPQAAPFRSQMLAPSEQAELWHHLSRRIGAKVATQPTALALNTGQPGWAQYSPEHLQPVMEMC